MHFSLTKIISLLALASVPTLGNPIPPTSAAEPTALIPRADNGQCQVPPTSSILNLARCQVLRLPTKGNKITVAFSQNVLWDLADNLWKQIVNAGNVAGDFKTDINVGDQLMAGNPEIQGWIRLQGSATTWAELGNKITYGDVWDALRLSIQKSVELGFTRNNYRINLPSGETVAILAISVFNGLA